MRIVVCVLSLPLSVSSLNESHLWRPFLLIDVWNIYSSTTLFDTHTRDGERNIWSCGVSKIFICGTCGIAYAIVIFDIVTCVCWFVVPFGVAYCKH